MKESLRTLPSRNKQLSQNKWYIAYTFPKAERSIRRKLEMMGFECYLPMHTVLRNWSDRKKKLELPLFPNYIFIYTTHERRIEALQIKEIVRYVCFDGKPVSVPETLIQTLKAMLTGTVEVSNERFVAGEKVRITDGPFTGAEGYLLRRNGTNRLVVQIEALQRTVSVDISASSVEPVNQRDYAGV